MSTDGRLPFDAKRFREVLGNYPTGVTVVTAVAPEHGPVGMAVGSFTSVSLEPPLVAFFPEKTSGTFPKIQTSGSFCVNVLAAAQERECRAFAARGADRFKDIEWRANASGDPVIDGVVAWIDCEIESVTEAGDHYIVIGRVRELNLSSPALPLVFFRGGYGKFSSLSLVAAHEADLAGVVRQSDMAREEMERIAAELRLECTAAAVVGNDMVVMASAGAPSPSSGPPMVGRRIPMTPPLGSQFMAWEPPEVVSDWLSRSPEPLGSDDIEAYHDLLHKIRAREWLLYTSDLGFEEVDNIVQDSLRHGTSPESDESLRKAIANLPIGFDAVEPQDNRQYDVRRVIVPVFGPDGGVALALNVLNPPGPCSADDIEKIRKRLSEGADRVRELLARTRP